MTRKHLGAAGVVALMVASTMVLAQTPDRREGGAGGPAKSEPGAASGGEADRARPKGPTAAPEAPGKAGSERSRAGSETPGARPETRSGTAGDKGGDAKRDTAEPKRGDATRDEAKRDEAGSRSRRDEKAAPARKDAGAATGSKRADDGKSGPEAGKADAAGDAAERGRARPKAAEREPRQPARDGERSGTARAGEETRGRAADANERRDDRRGEQRLTDTQRDRVRERILARQPNRAANVDITIRTGESLPRRVRLAPLPPAIVEIVPAYRNYRYVVVRDEIVIVEPRSYRVVDVIETSSRSAAGPRRGAQGGGLQLVLSSEQRRFVYEAVARRYEPISLKIRLGLGAQIPRDVELREFPAPVIERVPELGQFRFVFADRQVIVVDPDDQDVVLLIAAERP